MTPSQQIDEQIKNLPDWRGKMYAHLRTIINATDPNLKEEFKWGTAVWTHNGLVCAVSAFKSHVKMNFFKGASLEDKHKLFNAGLDAKTMRSIDFHEGDTINETHLKGLIHEAIALNVKKK